MYYNNKSLVYKSKNMFKAVKMLDEKIYLKENKSLLTGKHNKVHDK